MQTSASGRGPGPGKGPEPAQAASGSPADHGREHPTDTDGPWYRPPEPDRVDPVVLGALLARHGWQRRGGPPGRYGRWTPPGAPAGRATGTSLLVPESRGYPDSEDLLDEALTALDRSGTPAAREVLVALAVPSDEIRWWRDVPTGPAGSAAWPAEEKLRGAARRMLLAGALATRARAGYYGARHRGPAAALMREVLVGAAEGGRRLTAFVPVGTARPLALRLHQALFAAREAVDYRRATGGMDAFDGAVEAGVSHELTEALVALVRGTQGARVAVEWSPAAGAPEGCASSTEPVEFSPGDLPALREASARYLQSEPSVPVRITGTVVRMRRSGPRGEGTVRLRVIAGAEVARVRMTLDEEAYRIAGHAHLVGLPIRVHGRLQSRGGFRKLTHAHDVVPVQVDETERDRLMKSLQENLDFFEEACSGE
ncbi:hypothetical protein [Streptomyces sp. TS71-3]|uniref:hypothetical protein n=1 Tax=Streptomyces sp. TS71-3 TaxID=2733862 RepID=UPI0035AB853D